MLGRTTAVWVSTRLDVQEGSRSWLAVDATCQVGAQLNCQPEHIEVAPTYSLASSRLGDFGWLDFLHGNSGPQVFVFSWARWKLHHLLWLSLRDHIILILLYSSSRSSYKPTQIQSEGMYTHLSMWRVPKKFATIYKNPQQGALLSCFLLYHHPLW